MGQIEETIALVRKIESKLNRLGGNGRDLHEKIDSIEHLLPERSVKSLHWIAQMRNRLMHEDRFVIRNFPQYKEECLDRIRELNKLIYPPKKKSTESNDWCFIATAVYGSPDAWQVKTLRNYRNEVLQENYFGRIFIKFYYRYSPKVASFLKGRKILSKYVRRGLDIVIKHLL